jgi:alpha-beta hydrolase superfamily lysophospholipase
MSRLPRALSTFLTLAFVGLAGCAAREEAPPSSSESALEGCETLSKLSWMSTKRLDVGITGDLQVRVGEALPPSSTRVIGNILYLHGFADRIDNHKPLFDQWTKRGFRVIAFDYPSHGETCGESLETFTIDGLASLAAEVEERMMKDEYARYGSLPLYVAGWSTGGFLATHLVENQLAGAEPRLVHPVKGSVLFAPGVAVQPVLSAVTVESLTHDPHPPHLGAPSPERPALYPLFAGSMALAGNKVRASRYPDVPTIVFTGGIEDDTYADTPVVETWVKDHPKMIGVSCAGGRHELDNEAMPMGGQVRTMAGDFLAATAAGKPFVASRCSLDVP